MVFASTLSTGFSAIGLHSIWPVEATLVQSLSPIHAEQSGDDSQQAEFLCNLFSCLAESFQTRQLQGWFLEMWNLPFLFTDEQVTLFQRRFEEGYDILSDQDYVVWLHHHHGRNTLRRKSWPNWLLEFPK